MTQNIEIFMISNETVLVEKLLIEVEIWNDISNYIGSWEFSSIQ